MKLITKVISIVTAFCFSIGTIASPASAQLSAPVIPVKTGIQNQINFSEIPASAGMTNGAVFSGIKIYPQEPFRFDFLVDGDWGMVDKDVIHQPPSTNPEYLKLIKYFMASLTVPEGDLWVNLSPYEPDRIVPQALGQTEMGRDLLSQDYILKQLTASLMNPEGESGKRFWEKVYEKIYEEHNAPQPPLYLKRGLGGVTIKPSNLSIKSGLFPIELKFIKTTTWLTSRMRISK